MQRLLMCVVTALLLMTCSDCFFFNRRKNDLSKDCTMYNGLSSPLPILNRDNDYSLLRIGSYGHFFFPFPFPFS